MDAVLLPLDRAGVVPPLPPSHRHRHVGLERAGADLLEDLLAKRREVRGARLGEGVLGLQVGADAGVVLRSEPFVGILDLVAMVGTRDGAAGGAGCFGGGSHPTHASREGRVARATYAGGMASAPVRFGQYPPALRTIVHLSDTHFLDANRPLGGRFDTAANLGRTLQKVRGLGIHPDAIVVTGDLTDEGEPGAYRDLRELLEPLARELAAPLVWVAGNHDERPALREQLLDAEPTQEPVTGVWDLDGLRLIALDTSVPGWHHGNLDEGQLGWLREQLATPAPLGTLIAMHHPPIPSHLPFFDILELRDQQRLADVIAGTDVRGILAGHLHYSTSGTFAGVPVSVSAATCYTMNLARPAQQVNGMDAGQSFHLVHVYEATITHAVVPVVDADTGDYFSEEWVERMAALTPHERLEAFSRKRS